MQTTDLKHPEIGLLLEQNPALKTTIAAFKTSIDALTETISHQKQYILQLEEFIRHGRRQQFGASSEQLLDLHPSLFDEAETASDDAAASADATQAAEAAPEAKPARKPRKAFRIPPELPRVEIIHDLPEDEKVCPHDGTALKHIDCEIHEQLDIIPARVQVLRHLRYTYACPCCEQHVVTAQKPKQPIEKSMASPRLLAMIATQKYVGGSISRSH